MLDSTVPRPSVGAPGAATGTRAAASEPRRALYFNGGYSTRSSFGRPGVLVPDGVGCYGPGSLPAMLAGGRTIALTDPLVASWAQGAEASPNRYRVTAWLWWWNGSTWLQTGPALHADTHTFQYGFQRASGISFSNLVGGYAYAVTFRVTWYTSNGSLLGYNNFGFNQPTDYHADGGGAQVGHGAYCVLS
jgi:hypothetical protein